MVPLPLVGLCLAYCLGVILAFDCKIKRLESELYRWRRYGREVERARQADAKLNRILLTGRREVLRRAQQCQAGQL